MSMDTPVNVRLGDQHLLDKGRHLAQMLARRDQMVADEKERRGEAKADLEKLDAEISAEAAVLRDGFETRRQGDLFVDQMPGADRPAGAVADPSAEDAAAALAAVAEAAGETGEPKAPLPTEPHVYEGVAAEVDKCRICDAPEGDPVHHGGELLPHVFSPEVTDEPEAVSETCTFQGCGRGEGDAVHYYGQQQPDPVTAPKAADATPVAPCGACVAGECRVHTHAFGEGGEPDNKCRGCGKGRKARIHQLDAIDVVADPPHVTPAEDQEQHEAGQQQPSDLAYNFTGDEPPPVVEAQS